MSFLAIFCGVVLCLVFALWRTQATAAKLSRLNWEELLGRLEPVEAVGITTVALEYLQPSKSQIGMEPNEIWHVMGGAVGLAKMRANADVLIALAAQAHAWDLHESVIVAERMRRDGLALRRATTRIKLGLTFGYGRVRGAFYLHEAASAYYLMRERLLALYETTHAGRYSRLAAAL